jgi:hypothetical protein
MRCRRSPANRRLLGAGPCYVKESGFDEPDNASIVDPDGRGPAIGFLKVPEGKIAEPRTGRRMHLDVMPTGGTRDEEVVRLKGLGCD